MRALSGAMLFWLCVHAPLATAQSPLPDSFDPGTDGSVNAFAVQTDGAVVVGGKFTTLGGQTRSRLARLTADGLLDAGFNPDADGDVNALLLQADGKILVGGAFTTLAGQPRNYLARLHANGTLDTAFNPAVGGGLFSAYVSALAIQADGKILLGGYFSTVGGQARSSLARLNENGTVDGLFSPAVSGVVYSLALQADGKILLGGAFTQVNTQTRKNLARLESTGALDGFGLEANNAVQALMVQADGKILVGGRFTTVGGQPRASLGRLNSNGSLDEDFNLGANNRVYSLAQQADGSVLVAGTLTTLGGQPRASLGRLQADGTLDLSFDPGADGTVASLAIQTDGKVLVGGSFGTLGGQSRGGLGRLVATTPATQSLTCDEALITWSRGGSSPEVWRVNFEHSTDGVNWNPLGNAQRISGGWQLVAASPPPTGTLRARGQVASGQYNGSGWFAEATLAIHRAEPLSILLNDGHFGVSSNGFGFTIRGEPDQQVVVQASADLQQWTAVQTNTLTGGTHYFSDADWAQAVRQFYRVRNWP